MRDVLKHIEKRMKISDTEDLTERENESEAKLEEIHGQANTMSW